MRPSLFFPSRRRHTRWPRDWSSDVCSSDLRGEAGRTLNPHGCPGFHILRDPERNGCCPLQSVMENGLTIHITGKEDHPTDVVIRNLSLYTNQSGIENVGKSPVSADGKELSHLLFKRELTQQFLYIVKFPQSVAADRLRPVLTRSDWQFMPRDWCFHLFINSPLLNV